MNGISKSALNYQAQLKTILQTCILFNEHHRISLCVQHVGQHSKQYTKGHLASHWNNRICFKLAVNQDWEDVRKVRFIEYMLGRVLYCLDTTEWQTDLHKVRYSCNHVLNKSNFCRCLMKCYEIIVDKLYMHTCTIAVSSILTLDTKNFNICNGILKQS